MLTVSDTAFAIAFIRALEAELGDNERLFEDPYAQIFAAAGAHAREGTERFLSLPFFRDGIRLRTRHIDDVVLDAIARGTRQLVLMGAGFDARALRLPGLAQHGVRTFEIDLAVVLEAKRALLEGSGVSIPGAIRYLVCDFELNFEAPLKAELLGLGFNPGEPTIFVWEGVLAYIGQEAIDKSLHFMASIGAEGSRLIFDFSDYSLDSGQLAARLQRAGFSGFQDIRFDELWRRYLRGDPHPNAQFVKLGIALK